jgi:DNA-binding XRE family transcriptional regulator
VDDNRGAGLQALGETIKRLRIERGQGPGGLAFDAEIAEETLTTLEAGKTEPRWGTLRRIAPALGIELPELFARAEALEAEIARGGRV